MTVDERIEKLALVQQMQAQETANLRELVRQLALIVADHESRLTFPQDRILELGRWQDRVTKAAVDVS